MNTKMLLLIIGVVLIVIAVVLGGIQVSHAHNLYGASGHKWYFYSGVAVIGVVGIILAVWGLTKKAAPKQIKPPV